jgi:hypothetical protein
MSKSNSENEPNELVGEANNSQDRKVTEVIKQSQAVHKKLEQSIRGLQKSLDDLRVCVKYQAFDLEATRRENRYLRKLLEERDR